MALTTHPIYGDTEQLYNILSTSGLFTSVTKSIVENVKTITCSDTYGTRLVVKVTNVEADGSGGSTCGYTYYYGGDKQWWCLDFDNTGYETRDNRFPYIVWQTTSTIVIAATTRGASNPTWPLPCLVLTKDNNNVVGVLTSNGYSQGFWGSDKPRSISKDASAPIWFDSSYGVGNFAVIGSASTLVPVSTNDASKVTYFPKLFRGVMSQYQANRIGLATLNDNEYLSIYGAAFVRID